MKRFNNFIRLLLISLVMVGTAIGKETETEGTAFWFAIPRNDRSSTETVEHCVTGNSFEIWITSKVNTTVHLCDARQNEMKTIAVTAESYTIETLDPSYECTESETIYKDKAFYVTADDPVSIMVYVAYKWTGEAYRIVPEMWLGTDYYTLNLYQDECKMSDGQTHLHPSQFLIVATEDETTVDFWPTWDTQGGVKAGDKKTVRLNKGNSYLVLGKTNSLLTHIDETDLTGTKISADKPIAVYSGHTKGSFPLFAPTYCGSLKADFLRNMLFDSMWPVELLGKEYVFVPNRYDGRQKGYDQHYIADMEGDMLRFVATKDNTTIYQTKSDGTGKTKVITLKKAGQWYQITTIQDPAVFTATQPVLVGQYGKGWFYWSNGINPKEGDDDSKEDELQNPEQNGQGNLYTLTPNEQWANYAGFIAPPSVNNFFNLIFKTGDEEYISFGNATSRDNIKALYGSGVKKIPGTEYSYVSQPAPTGGNYVESTKSDVKFALYAYGNMDAPKDGFAYGYPTTVNYFTPCNDSIYIDATQECNVVSGTINAINLQEDTLCAAIQSFKYEVASRENARFTSDVKQGTQTGTFTVTFTDANKPGYIKLIGITKSGSSVTREFTYSPELISANPTQVQFGLLEANVPSTQNVVITNPGATDLHVVRLYLKDDNRAFTILTQPTEDFIIPAGESVTYTVQALITGSGETGVRDELYAELACSEPKLATLVAASGDPNLTMNDLEWPNIPVGASYQTTKEVVITNAGSSPAYITGYTLSNPDDVHFTFTGDIKDATESNPVTIDANGKMTLMVTYDHKGEAGVNHEQTLTLLSSNTTQTKLYSNWIGNAINAALTITGWDWEVKRVIDEWSTTEDNVNNYEATITVTNNGTDKIEVSDVKLCNRGENSLYTDPAFTVDADDLAELQASGLEANASKDLKVYFTPLEQIDYACDVKAIGRFEGQDKESNVGALDGKGKQPHVTAYDQEFDYLDLNKETTSTKDVTFEATAPVQGVYAMDLKVVGYRIEGANAAKFDFADGFAMPSRSNPTIIPVGTNFTVPVVFTPETAGEYTAQLVIECDAPNGTTDDKIAELTGSAFSYGVTTTDASYPATYITTTATGKTVSITNQSSTPIYLTKSLKASLEDNVAGSYEANAFTLTKATLSDNSNVELDAENVEIAVGGTLTVSFDFKPTSVKTYAANLVYTYAVEDPTAELTFEATSHMTGIGKDYYAVVEIPAGYKAYPGEEIAHDGISWAEMKFYKDNSETKSLDDANITEFSCVFTFTDPILDANGKHVFPKVNSNGLVDIVTDETMTKGWNVTSCTLNNNASLQVTMKSSDGSALKASNDNVLFRFKMLGYLAQTGVKVALSPYFTPQGAPNGYVHVRAINGDVEILKVCVDSTRLIEFSGMNYDVKSVTPNPVVNEGTIGFTTPIECPVTIDVFDAMGSKVTTLVNEVKTAGTYEVRFDANTLGIPSGSYTYRINMGPYSETKTMVITK